MSLALGSCSTSSWTLALLTHVIVLVRRDSRNDILVVAASNQKAVKMLHQHIPVVHRVKGKSIIHSSGEK